MSTDVLSGDKLLFAAQKIRKIKSARESLLDFVQFTMPDLRDMDNPDASRYKIEAHHRAISDALEKVARGEILRLAISMPPQHGKSELASRRFLAWYIGKFPWKKLIFGTYSQDFAETFGGEVREILRTEQYKLVFPGTKLVTGSRAKDFMRTTEGGQLAFVGRGGPGTGKPADLAVIDDPIKDDMEAQSPAIREQCYQWFTKVIYSRAYTASAIIIIHTRWNEDDLIGRIVDPDHPDHDPEIAKDWMYLHIPAVMQAGPVAAALGAKLEAQTEPAIVSAFGSKPIASLWPERFSLRHLASAKRLNPRGFEALYQGNPAPEEGDYFKRDDLIGYLPGELPKNLRKYAASDHAVTEKQQNDPVCLGCVGVDENDIIWVLPDIVWQHMETDRMVEEMIAQMERHRPMLWWAEDDVIKKSIGPFLRKRQRTMKQYTPVVPMSTAKTDKVMRARSAQGLTQLHMVRFPIFAPWWQKAQNELLKFPNGAHDDFVDWLAWIGIGLDSELKADRQPANDAKEPKSGTIAWIKKRAEQERKRVTELAEAI